MPTALPSIDNSTCAAWLENDIDLYNSYDFFLAKTQVERRKQNMVFSKLTKKKPWKANMGSIMRGVRKNPSPHLRQFAFPNPITAQPKVDTLNVTETKSDAILYWQDFESPALSFLPSFQDFLDHVTDHGEDIMEKIERYEEVFIRGMMFHMSPFMFIARGDQMTLVNTTPFNGLTALNPATMGKTTATLAGFVNQYQGDISHLTMRSLAHGLTQMSVNLGIPPFSGTGLPTGDDKALDQKYALITHEEAWTQFSFDPYLQQHKNCDLDVVNDSFRGSLFGRLTAKLETMPMYMKSDGTFAEPEIRVETDVALNDGETVPNPTYTGLDSLTGSPYAISYLCGNIGYDSIQVGPPPSAFTKDTPPHNFPAMQWNGEVYLTKDFLLECVDPITGAVRTKTNSKGRWLKYESTATLGIFPRQRRNVIPILHLRKQLV